MAKYRITNKAVEDLSSIWNYTRDTWSERQADHYYSMLIDYIEEIVINPNIGKSYEDIINKIMGLRAGRHIIFYRLIEANEVEVIRVLHERMDLKKRIKE
jgi:toxin ParE1/3/4